MNTKTAIRKTEPSTKIAARKRAPATVAVKPRPAARRQRPAQATPKNQTKSAHKPTTAKTAKSPVATKQSRLIELLQRPAGANLSDLIDATGWQAHSVRGVISGILRKKLGLTVASETNAQGTRMYRIHPAAGAGK